MAASSSSAISQEIKYDVFISFRGKDVRNNFLGHLHAALCPKSIRTFVDDQLDRGDDISTSLFNTIKASKISVIIFSERYADSKWCLQELEQILDCKRTFGQIVIPIFYKIDPSNVRHQNGSFGAGFAELEKRLTKISYDLEGLKDALVEAADLSDWTINEKKLETSSIEAIVGDISKKLNILKHQEGTFANKLKEGLEKRLDDLNNLKADLDRWKAALEAAANLAGYTVNDNRSEIELINKTVADILYKLNNMSAKDDMDLVGVGLSIQKVESLLRIGSDNVRAVGIWGPGGIGKTTIGLAVFNKILNQFEDSYFARDVREKSQESNESLRQEILSKILGDGHANIELLFTKERLGRKKVLLAFDDLTSLEQIEKSIGGFRNLGPGSRIIITTRDKQVLRGCELGDDDIYEVKGLFGSNALKLFEQFAFGQNCPINADFAGLSIKMVSYAKGVPLALKVLGSFLRGKSKKDWESEWKKLKEYPNQDIQRVLRRSYEGLDGNSQSIFLDIAYFFKGWKTYNVEDILDAGGFYTQTGLTQLVDKSLISISYGNMICMHDLLQEMGLYIVREKCKHPGQHSRLCNHNHIIDVLKKNMGTVYVEGISFDTSTIRHIRLKSDAFAKMCNLRLLEVYTSTGNKFSGVEGLESLPDGLTYFKWEAYPSRSLPSEFFAEKLVRLDMRRSNLEHLWDDVQDLEKLKYVNLSHSTQLKKIPDLSKAKNLQELILSGCLSLENIDSIQYLSELVELDLSNCDSLSIVPDGAIQSAFVSFRGCSNLMVAPKISCKVEKLDLSGAAIKESPLIEYPSRLTSLDLSDCSKLESLSSSICECKHLKYLHLNACPKLEWLPDDLGNLEELEELEISGSNLKELPPSSTKLSKLRSLSLSRFMNQKPLSWPLTSVSGFKFLESLMLANCGITMLPDDLGQLSLLKWLVLSGNNFKSMPAMKNLHHLMVLNICHCESLTSLPELPRCLCLIANNCSSLTTVSNLSFLFGWPINPTANFANCFKLNLSEVLHEEFFPENCYPEKKIVCLFGVRIMVSSMALNPLHNLRKILVDDLEILRKHTPEMILKHASEMIPKHVLEMIPKHASGKIRKYKSEMLRKRELESRPNFSHDVLYPGNEMLNWFNLRNEGSSLTLDPLQLFDRKSFLGLIMAAVVAFPERHYVGEIKVVCSFLIKLGYDEFYLGECEMRTWPRCDIESDHTIMIFNAEKPRTLPICIRCLNDKIQIGELGNSEVLVKFSAGNFEVKQCGLKFLSGKEHRTREERPRWICPFERFNAYEDDSDLHLDDENEEGEESQPKRLKIYRDLGFIRVCSRCHMAI